MHGSLEVPAMRLWRNSGSLPSKPQGGAGEYMPTSKAISLRSAVSAKRI